MMHSIFKSILQVLNKEYLPKFPPSTILPKCPPPPSRKVGPYGVFYSFALVMETFFLKTQLKSERNLPQTFPPPGPFFVKNQFYTSILDLFCHQKVKSVFSKHLTIIRFFDTLKKMPPFVT